MKRLWCGLFVAIFSCLLCHSASAILIVGRGNWPATWPKELGPLRQRSQTVAGPSLAHQVHSIPFAKREDFEAAWPHLLKVKTPGTSIILRKSRAAQDGKGRWIGVRIESDPQGQPSAEQLKTGQRDDRVTLTLYVDGEVVDLNRIPLPANTSFLDERFQDSAK